MVPATSNGLLSVESIGLFFQQFNCPSSLIHDRFSQTCRAKEATTRTTNDGLWKEGRSMQSSTWRWRNRASISPKNKMLAVYWTYIYYPSYFTRGHSYDILDSTDYYCTTVALQTTDCRTYISIVRSFELLTFKLRKGGSIHQSVPFTVHNEIISTTRALEPIIVRVKLLWTTSSSQFSSLEPRRLAEAQYYIISKAGRVLSFEAKTIFWFVSRYLFCSCCCVIGWALCGVWLQYHKYIPTYIYIFILYKVQLLL